MVSTLGKPRWQCPLEVQEGTPCWVEILSLPCRQEALAERSRAPVSGTRPAQEHRDTSSWNQGTVTFTGEETVNKARSSHRRPPTGQRRLALGLTGEEVAGTGLWLPGHRTFAGKGSWALRGSARAGEEQAPGCW